ncbi:fungal specific transcription factor domain-containing protein [Sarocladium implicatum]|nr:fungal specific transcription factor domain-containing protein [Sarocladium implicatum]
MASGTQEPAHDQSSNTRKKRRRNGERARVTRACDRCKRRKVRCNGSRPCDICLTAKTSCTFDSVYTRGRAPVIGGNPGTPELDQASHVHRGQRPVSSPLAPVPITTRAVPTVVQDTSQFIPHDNVRREPSNNTSKPDAATRSSQDGSPEPSQTDLQGHYIGPASGVSFLLRVQKRLHQSISFSNASTIFTFGDAPFHRPDFEPSFCMMLPREDAQQLLRRYFDFAMPTYRFLHRPTLQSWFDEFYETLGTMHDPQSAPAKIALLFMVFAHGRVYMPDDNKPGPDDLSTRYFLAAEHQLERERGSIGLTSVQARLTQCYYLLTQSRINHCWSLFGTVAHLALAIGLNRNKKPSKAGGISVVEVEGRRRTFWCAYTLDAYLSVALGRPLTFHIEDIDTELPACVDDDEITTDVIQQSGYQAGPSTMLASIGHIKLARILSKIIRDLYSIKPISANRRALVTERISKDLSDWRVDLSQFLDMQDGSSSLLAPIFQRQRNVLNLTYWHAIILTYRPFVLNNLAQLARRGGVGATDVAGSDLEIEESVKQCLVAAMSTVKTIDDIASGSNFFRSFWITAYMAFTATIVLYIYVIQKRASPPEVYSEYFIAAARCQSHLSSIAADGSLSQRYCLVLEELRVEALRQIKRMNPSLVPTNGTDDQNQQQNHGQTSLDVGNDISGVEGMDAAMAMGIFDNSPSAATNYTDLLVNAGDGVGAEFSFPAMEFSGWDQFAHMVSSGLGNLDGFR